MCIEQKERYVGERANELIVAYGPKGANAKCILCVRLPLSGDMCRSGSILLLSTLPFTVHTVHRSKSMCLRSHPKNVHLTIRGNIPTLTGFPAHSDTCTPRNTTVGLLLIGI